ncbi:MAG: sulfotransferase family 2 domain-containing protein [Gammaproteobacteria bacterium]
MSIQYGILHLRKTAGTALKTVIERQMEVEPLPNVQCFEHVMTLPKFIKEYPTAQAIFFVRDPISRFVSGFYSRLRQGRPRYYYPWRPSEAKAFSRFQTPNQLAEALSGFRFGVRRHAIAAMKSIGHVRHTYLDCLGSPAFLERVAHRIAFIGHQQDFDADLERLRSLLKIRADILAPNDDVGAHRNPQNLDKYLSGTALANLEEWYAPDFAIYQWCLAKRERIMHGFDRMKHSQEILEEVL